MRSWLVFAGIALGLAACSNGSSGPADTGPMVPPDSCGQPGDLGNEMGVGAFCTPGGSECTAHPTAGLCLATLSPSDGQWFCTRLCTDDSMCGTNAVCTGDPRGRACVPARCASSDDAGTPMGDGGPRDAGAVDGGAVDAGSASDVGTDAP